MKDMTKGNPWSEILYFTIPLLLGNVFQQLYIIIDSIVVGHYIGKQALGAIGASFPIIFLLVSLIMGLTMGASVVISQYFGAKKHAEVKRTIDTLYISMLAVSVLFTIFGPLVSTKVLTLMHTPQDILSQAKTFIDIYLYGITLAFGYNTVSAVLRALGDSKTPTVFLIYSTVINSILVILFVVGFHWGIAGSAFATLLAQGFSFLGLVRHVNRRENTLLHVRANAMRFDMPLFKKMLFIGMPAGVQQMFVSLGMMAITRMVNNYGTDMIAGFTAASRLDTFALMPAMNLSLAVSTFVGQNIGAGLWQRVRSGIGVGLCYGTIFSVLISTVILLFGEAMLSWFTADQVLIHNGLGYFHIAGWFYIVFAVMFVFGGFFRGAGDTIMPMIMTLFSMWLIRVPAARYLSHHIGIAGIWWSFVIGWGFGLVLSVGYYMTGIWKRFKVVAPRAG